MRNFKMLHYKKLHADLSGAPSKSENIYIMTLNGLNSLSDC